MTRINVVDPKTLSREHLIAEYREITRVPGNLKKSLNRKSKPFSLQEIPSEYTLGTGHVKFFYDKMQYLEKRFLSLVDEMVRREYNPQHRDGSIFRTCPPNFYNDYKPTADAVKINKQRIKERS